MKDRKELIDFTQDKTTISHNEIQKSVNIAYSNEHIILFEYNDLYLYYYS